MATLNEEIQEAIRRDLPARVGEELRSQLNAGTAAVLKVAELEKALTQVQDTNLTLASKNSALESRASAVASLASANEIRDKALRAREDKMAAIETELKLRIEFNATLRDVVKDVFSNNRFKYFESYPVQQHNTANGCSSSYTKQETRAGEGEGLSSPPGPVIG